MDKEMDGAESKKKNDDGNANWDKRNKGTKDKAKSSSDDKKRSQIVDDDDRRRSFIRHWMKKIKTINWWLDIIDLKINFEHFDKMNNLYSLAIIIGF